MKHTSKLFILMSLLLFISACKAIPEKSTSVIDNPENTDLKTYLKEVDLPNHFSITFNPETILIKQEASIYTASLLEIDENKAIEVLLQGDVVEAGNYAEGPMFKTVGETFQEYLYVYDGGESF